MKLRRYRRQPRAADGVLLGFDSLPIAEAIGDSIAQTTEVPMEQLKQIIDQYTAVGRDGCKAAVDAMQPEARRECAKIAADVAAMLEGHEPKSEDDEERERRVAGAAAAHDAIPGLGRIGC